MKRISILFSCMLLLLLHHANAQLNTWQWAPSGTGCAPAPVALPANFFTAAGEVHPPGLPCGNWSSFSLQTNMCVSNNFSVFFNIRNNDTSGGTPSNDISLRVAGPNLNEGVVLIDNTQVSAGQPASTWLAFTNVWVGTAPPSPNNQLAALMVPDNRYHLIELQYQNGTLSVFRDRTANPTAIAVTSYTGSLSFCSITQISIGFKGMGWIDRVSAVDNTTGLNWTENFTNGTNYTVPTATNCPVAATLNPTFTPPSCQNNTLTLNAGAPAGATVTWSGPSGQSYTGNTVSIPAPSASANGTWTINATSGCTSTTGTLPVSFSIPTLGTATRKDTTICIGDSIRLWASGGGSYSWTPTSNLSNPNIANPLAWPSSATIYTVLVTNGSCTRRDTIKVTPETCHCEDSCSWSLTGNLNVKAKNFIGSINNADFKIRTNNTQRMVVTAGGNVGIGTATPGAALEVNSQASGSSGLRFTQTLAPTSPNGTVLSVDAGGNVILVPDQNSGGSGGWNLNGNDVDPDCGSQFIGTNSDADLRFHAAGTHWMRLTKEGSLSIEPNCNSNTITNNTNIVTGEVNSIVKGSYNAVNGSGNDILGCNTTLVSGTGNVIAHKKGVSQDNFITGFKNTMTQGAYSVIMGTNLYSSGENNFHLGAGSLRNVITNSLMLGWGDLHTMIANQEGVAIHTGSSNEPSYTNTDLATARLDVDGRDYKSEIDGNYRSSGVRFRKLAPGKGRTLVIDDEGYVHVDGERAAPDGDPIEPAGRIDALQKEVETLKQQVQLLMKALQTAAPQNGGNTLEVLPTPFDKHATANYSLERFSGKAQLQVTDASGKVLQSYPIRNAKGSVAVDNLWTNSGVLFFSIVDNGSVLVTVRGLKMDR